MLVKTQLRRCFLPTLIQELANEQIESRLDHLLILITPFHGEDPLTDLHVISFSCKTVTLYGIICYKISN